ncbi:TetR family transcriptional regulator [Pseudomonas sp. FSL R10-0056]|uniref:TetR/AcrR family transcriptional regulator n=1 Tax=Pseudomonas TaxID=286 RepID=UPI000BA294B4|nr:MULTISPECIES: TetR/AcrR family transcriptional regulator [Pseudomonas]MDN5390907.1 TetR/AcrR family transcriptional regulator [Pseudomonas sp.]MDN5393133.1 TetR/AcrR family transcriptional regulator [Pseudomonas sp.]MDN5406743.1 TetR/AcrR family transcriptional regulator [Pseudomonas sp.]MDN5455204.1 TetR/AcrR family transcriptional regulator [Pseudomonas sp.]MDN5459232.1 TetR/AcrR family transcriptional regulator [Pseudomonas sp.]
MSDNPLPPNALGRPKDLAKRQSILDAAKTLFLTKGYANTSMDAVAGLAGVSKLTVYSHFTDKETLFSSAIMSKCTEQLPVLFFELPAGKPIKDVLVNIARGFQVLINSEESLNLHRLMVALGSQDPKLSQIFLEAGPERVVHEMEGLLRKMDQSGALQIDNPHYAAEHFFCMLKGAPNFRLLFAGGEPPGPEESEAHVQEVVGIFMRAYQPLS